MPAPYRVIAFSGSLRRGSTNTALILMAKRLAPEELQIDIVDWVDELPWMNPDLEADPPEPVRRWWDTLRAADGLLVGMPEYNFSPTPLAKNAIDWATRPPDDRAVRLLNGPGANGTDIRNPAEHELTAGDVLVIPAGTGHQFTKIDDHITYLMIRVDPDKVVPLMSEADSRAYLDANRP